ncbi:MAG TPA: tRNA (adenosine(37)-N6)-threonylcarbamoyltransferase complex ATPase subunit type 1 TsaE [Thermoanaerobaculia bacterium]|nr:tRNA (adenosine(37)-N6)-threonylcarbamoyltransferase complex ATPase subunit type 1 TsaE [Thermoanaerobaculia bacterium]
MIRLRTQSAAETLRLGVRIGRLLLPGSVVGLDGDLGTGKTWMAKGLVRGIGDFDDELVKSPAYNLVHEYAVAREGGALPVVHIDFYRLEELTATDRQLFEEYFGREEAIVIVEWAGRFLAELAPAYLAIGLALCADGDPECRDLSIGAVGDPGRYDRVLRELAEPAEPAPP